MPSCTALIGAAAFLTIAWLRSLPCEPPLLKGKPAFPAVVVVTGGTSGLGLATVLTFAARGDTVFTCGRNTSAVAQLNGVNGVHASVVDVSKPEQVAGWARELSQRAISIDGLINNAGKLRVGDPAAAITMAAYDEVMDVNFRGVVATTTAFWPLLKRGKGGAVVVNIGSTTETPKLAQAFHSIYSASKCALRAYSAGLRQEGKLGGVSVIHVKAGSFKSNLHSAFAAAGATLGQYPSEFAKHAESLQASILGKLKLVSEQSAEYFADRMFAIVHGDRGADPASGEYWLNVGWLEMLAEILPQALLDFAILRDYSGSSGSGGEL